MSYPTMQKIPPSLSFFLLPPFYDPVQILSSSLQPHSSSYKFFAQDFER